MRLDPLYTVTFTTPEAWSVEVAADAGIEGRGFLLAEGRSPPGATRPASARPTSLGQADRRGTRARVARGARDRRRWRDPVRVAGGRGGPPPLRAAGGGE